EGGGGGKRGGKGQAPGGGPKKAPGAQAGGLVGGGFNRESKEVAETRQPPAREPPLYRARLSTDARSPALPAPQRVQDLYRDRRRAGLRAHIRSAGLRHPARAGSRHRGRNKIWLRQRRQTDPDQGAEAHLERQ